MMKNTTRRTLFVSLITALFHPFNFANAAAPIDCPLRDQPYSVDSPLMDILLNPRARAAVDSVNPGLLDKLPPTFISTTAPSFSAIMSMRRFAPMRKMPESDLSAIDTALAKVLPTEDEKNVRCARYDNDDPKIEPPKGKPRLLLFEKINGFRDGPSVEASRAMFVAMAARNEWSLTVTDKGGAINPNTLKKFDAVIWNNNSGDVLTLTQRKALQDYLAKGGGFVGIHGAAGDPVYFWEWYADTLIGARFIGHPMNPQFQEAKVNIHQTPSAIGKDLAPGWSWNEEWYSFKNNPRATGSHIIATLDESTYTPVGFGNQDLRMGDHPIVWTRCVNNGRMFYSAIGHRPESYTESHHIKLIEEAVVWASGLGKSHCVDGQELN